MTISELESAYYRLSLVTLTDAMNGDMPDFELNTVRLQDSDGVEGIGYTFTDIRDCLSY